MHILIIRIGRLGDIVMILPALKAITKRYPNATLHILTTPDGMRLFKNLNLTNPYHLYLYRHPFHHRIFDTLSFKRLLKNQTFDHIFCFENKKRIVDCLPKHAHILPKFEALEHYALRCLKLVNPVLEIEYQKEYLPFHPKKESELKSLLALQGINDKTILIGLHPTYSGLNAWGKQKEHIHRLWPWESFAKLAQKLQNFAATQGIDLKVVMDLLPEESELGARIVEASDEAVILLPTKPDFNRYLSYIKRLNVLVAPNTGVMHLAAALNIPLVALFSKHLPEDCGPFMPENNCVVLRAEETSTPDLGLAVISVEAVFEAVIFLIKNCAKQ